MKTWLLSLVVIGGTLFAFTENVQAQYYLYPPLGYSYAYSGYYPGVASYSTYGYPGWGYSFPTVYNSGYYGLGGYGLQGYGVGGYGLNYGYNGLGGYPVYGGSYGYPYANSFGAYGSGNWNPSGYQFHPDKFSGGFGLGAW